MRKYFISVIFILLFLKAVSFAQSVSYIVKPAPFSSRIYNEFSPVFYKEGIVFCSDQSDNSLVSYKDNQNRLFKIFYVTRRGSTAWSHPKILAKEITSAFNDGPLTFNENGNIMYYSRNNSIENSLRNISDTSNKLGIYSAELRDGIWTNIKSFAYNNPLHSFYTPALSPDGDRIYFSSDMPGGFGGMDLYYCNRRNNDWDKPVNLGPVINTIKNEFFPFACRYGKLYFASDGHKGFGGKDLFYTQEINGEWIVPVHLDSAINSPFDDFGLVIDSTLRNGYFSSNRRKTDDIYSFSSAAIEFANCDSIRENNYCFTFYDEKRQTIDTVPLIYKWDFGDGIVRDGKEVMHCFNGPGNYPVKLSIIDGITGDTLTKQSEYKVELENIEQVYINSYNFGMADKSISLEGVTSDLKGFRITDYFWNFGDGFKPGGPFMNTTFKKKGDYTIQLGLLAEKDSMGVIPKICVMKKIRIYNNYEELVLKGETMDHNEIERTDSAGEQNKTLQIRIHFMDDLSARQKAKIRESVKDFGKQVVRFDQYGVKPSSDQFLSRIAAVLKENPDIRLESVLNATEDERPGNKMGISEKWSRELGFYFKNKKVDMNIFRSKGSGSPDPVFEPFVADGKTIDGVIEFVFMKK
jgi:hypothetical protein